MKLNFLVRALYKKASEEDLDSIFHEVCSNFFYIATNRRSAQSASMYFVCLPPEKQAILLEQVGKNVLYRICLDINGNNVISEMFTTTVYEQQKFVDIMGVGLMQSMSKNRFGSHVAKRFSRVLKMKRLNALQAAENKLSGVVGA